MVITVQRKGMDMQMDHVQWEQLNGRRSKCTLQKKSTSPDSLLLRCKAGCPRHEICKITNTPEENTAGRGRILPKSVILLG